MLTETQVEAICDAIRTAVHESEVRIVHADVDPERLGYDGLTAIADGLEKVAYGLTYLQEESENGANYLRR